MTRPAISNVVGFDDFPFPRAHRGDVRVPGGRRKWALVERAGQMEPASGVFVQRAGLSLEAAGEVIRRFSTYGNLPEPLRVAHLIAGGVGTGQSRGRA